MTAGHALLLGALVLAGAAKVGRTGGGSSGVGGGGGGDVDVGSGGQAGGAGGYLLTESAVSEEKLDKPTDPLDATLSSILNRQGPDMRPLRDFRDDHDISLEVSQRAWQLMHQHARVAISERVAHLLPIVERALTAANVSARCVIAARNTLHAAQQLDSSAIQLLNAWGSFPPTGLFEGTYGDIGSFHGCLAVPESEAVGHAHYCTIAYRPVLPKRPDYELIVRKEPDALLHLFDQPEGAQNGSAATPTQRRPGKDALSELLQHAHYNHYVYYKFGTCFPIQCSPRDVQKLARLLGRRSILMSGPVKCHSKRAEDYEEQVEELDSKGGSTTETSKKQLKLSTRDLNDGLYIWKPHMTRSQWISLLALGALTSLVLVLTLVDIVINRIPALLRGNRHSLGASRLAAKAEVTEMKEEEGRVHIKADLCDNNNNNNNIEEDVCENNNNNTTTCLHPHHQKLIRLLPMKDHDEVEALKKEAQEEQQVKIDKRKKQRSLFMEVVKDYSLVTNLKQFVHVSQSQLKNDILCINGIRCITMSWIIVTHTMQYNDWSAFARTREIETHLKSLINQPLFNGSYLVDTFFLVSGLLTSYSSFKASGGSSSSSSSSGSSSSTEGNGQPAASSLPSRKTLLARFSTRSYLIGRYLRLTPQIMLVSLLFILLPLLSHSGGPHWYTITGEYSENCSENWWVNLLHIQAFYRSSEMCNFVCWWISVDMLYHLFALAIILMILYLGHSLALISCCGLIIAHGLVLISRHYSLSLPPNLLSTIPQTGAMWSNMTLKLFWTPYAHAFPFFMGFYLGYLMARRQSLIVSYLSPRRALIGWLLASGLLVGQSYSTYFWVVGRWRYTPLTSTAFYLVCPIVWSSCLGWIIVACQYGYGGFINKMLSCRLFLVLGKASYVVYLSHFLVLFTFFGSQNLLLEPTQLMMLYIIAGNICLAMLLGAALCVAFEMPWLKTQRRLMQYV